MSILFILNFLYVVHCYGPHSFFLLFVSKHTQENFESARSELFFTEGMKQLQFFFVEVFTAVEPVKSVSGRVTEGFTCVYQITEFKILF